jgi:formamidopyrimidine-DNA glycosylase
MPELPEVETSRRGIAPWLEQRRVDKVVVRDRRLRWPVPMEIDELLPGQVIRSLERRAKYLLFDTEAGTAIMHLGMSGSVRIIDAGEPAGKHDHVDIELNSGKALRFRDPRRFGCLLWADDPASHALISRLGPEPLSDEFSGGYLWRAARTRRLPVKQFLMNAAVVVGVGNIYASESLFTAGINPKRRANRISRQSMDSLATAVKQVLQAAIDAGGTTLRDFYDSDGEPGYFRQKLSVYGRDGEPCRKCREPVSSIVQGQRSTFYCKRCQT